MYLLQREGQPHQVRQPVKVQRELYSLFCATPNFHLFGQVASYVLCHGSLSTEQLIKARVKKNLQNFSCFIFILR